VNIYNRQEIMMALQDTMGYASTAVTAGYVEQANEAQAPRPVSVRVSENMGYASVAITQDYVERSNVAAA